jgi:pyruvate,water dikinase
MEDGLHANTGDRGDFIKWFEELSMQNLPLVGGKTASLGEMYSNLKKLGIEVPYGFAITTKAYLSFVKEHKLDLLIAELSDSQKLSKEDLGEKAKEIQAAFLQTKISGNLKEEILSAYKKLKQYDGKDISVAVRSSATSEDLPEASFAGLHESFLNVKDEEQLLQKCVECFASLYTERAVSYRQDKNITQTKVYLSICIQKMTRSDLACSGVIFTIDTETGFKDAIIINASWGLGENIVKGVVNPDDYIIFKTTLDKGFAPILQKKMGGKEFKLVYQEHGTDKNETLQNLPTSQEEKSSFCLNEKEILTLSRWALLIEKHYSKIKGKNMPMDIEWAKDGLTGELYILQARPETVHSANKSIGVDFYSLKADGKLLLTGDSVGTLIGQGKVRIIRSKSDLSEFQEGEVLVAEKTEPDWEPFMKKSAAIITDRGGRTCHAAIVSRELGIPAVVGTLNATEVLKTGQEVTVACIFGSQCSVFEGLLPFEHKIISLKNLTRPKTKIMMNLANPSMAFKSSLIPNDGVGLLRMEFIISNTIKIHPMALVRFNTIKDQALKEKIEALCIGSISKTDFFVDQLARGIAMISAAFYPKKVIVRLSDFKSDEYKNLVGGELFEVNEENPMIGFRGASRYYDDAYREAFALECRAIKKVRDEMGLINLAVMVPFCRTVNEGIKVLDEMQKYGLQKGKDNLEVYVMCEIPSNAILAEEFAEIFDGFSIGSNDLTQLTLGVDRNSAQLSHLFSEDDPAVLKMIKLAISGAHKKRKIIGLCGQRPSDDPAFAKFLVENKIDSISLNPDAVIKVTEVVIQMENLLDQNHIPARNENENEHRV